VPYCVLRVEGVKCDAYKKGEILTKKSENSANVKVAKIKGTQYQQKCDPPKNVKMIKIPKTKLILMLCTNCNFLRLCTIYLIVSFPGGVSLYPVRIGFGGVGCLPPT